MGIPSYFSYIVKNYPHILSKFVSRERAIDNLYLDCNSILYDVYHRLVYIYIYIINNSLNLSKVYNIIPSSYICI